MDEFNPNEKKTKPAYNDDLEDPGGIENNLIDEPVFIPDQKRDEEIAAEMTSLDEETIINKKYDNDYDDQLSNIPGWIALGLAVLSFFMMPIIIGGAAIIVGFVARNRGALWLGNISIAIGVVSIIVRLFLIPFV